MLKILYLINHAGKAGTEKYVYTLAKEYHNKKAECFFAYNETGLLVEQMKQLGISITKIKMKHPFDIMAAKKVANLCKEKGIDIIHTQYPRENYIALLAKMFYPKIKAVYTCHLTLEIGGVWKFTNKIMTAKNHKIIAVCNNAKQLMVAGGVPEDKIEVIFNGVPYNNVDKNKKQLLEEFKIKGNPFIITTLARCEKEKGLGFLINSINELKKLTKKPFKCLIAGDGELFDELSVQIDAHGLSDDVLMLGYINNTKELLAGSDIFVNSASGREALSFAILEAMSVSLPIIATNIGGNPDIINSKTNCGLLVEYGNNNEMAKAILRLMSDDDFYTACSQNATKAVKDTFSIENMLKKTFKIY